MHLSGAALNASTSSGVKYRLALAWCVMVFPEKRLYLNSGKQRTMGVALTTNPP